MTDQNTAPDLEDLEREYEEQVAVAFGLTEDELALEFTRRHAAELRYVALWGGWLHWDGQRWQREQTARVFDLARNVCRAAGEGLADAKLRARIMSASTRAAVENMARSDRRHAATVGQWDSHQALLGTPEGTVDLRTGALRPPTPSNYITKVTAVAPAPAGTAAPIWQAFLERIFRHDLELIPFVHRALGYSLLGEIKDHVLLFCWGPGGNGKGVLLNTVSRILGDYAAVAPGDLLLVTQSERHPCDVAMLRGSRFVTAQELAAGRAWDEPKLKGLTGGDPITARFMRQDFFTYEPQFTLWVAGNHKPSFRGVDEAIRRRVLLLPFTQVISAAERDPDLSEKLKAEWPAILRLMIDGCLAYQREGLNPPASALAATKSYLDGEDTLGQWLEERCVVQPRIDWTSLKTLYADWSAWSLERGQRPGTARSLSKALDERGIEREHRKTGQGFCGVGLLEQVSGDGSDGTSANTRHTRAHARYVHNWENRHFRHQDHLDDDDREEGEI